MWLSAYFLRSRKWTSIFCNPNESILNQIFRRTYLCRRTCNSHILALRGAGVRFFNRKSSPRVVSGHRQRKKRVCFGVAGPSTSRECPLANDVLRSSSNNRHDTNCWQPDRKQRPRRRVESDQKEDISVYVSVLTDIQLCGKLLASPAHFSFQIYLTHWCSSCLKKKKISSMTLKIHDKLRVTLAISSPIVAHR